MRRLTLILSDLYLPADAARESFPTTMQLPALEWLLRFSKPALRIQGWRSWLAAELGASALAGWPEAHTLALADEVTVDGSWLATPVALEARLDHVRLRDRGLLRLPLEQKQALQQEFQEVFGGGLRLRAGRSPAFSLDGGPQVDIATQDPARWLDADIGRALPGASAAAGELRRLGTEIEMWLHSSPVNAARERAGQRRVSALWLWGGGRSLPKPAREKLNGLRSHVHGSDNFVTALQNLLGHAIPQPANFTQLSMELPTFMELAPMSGPESESLLAIERDWFAPARDALSAGTLESFRVVANDRVFECSGRPGWRFWRRRRGWLESLA